MIVDTTNHVEAVCTYLNVTDATYHKVDDLEVRNIMKIDQRSYLVTITHPSYGGTANFLCTLLGVDMITLIKVEPVQLARI